MSTDTLNPPVAADAVCESDADAAVPDTVIDLHRAAELILADRPFIRLQELPDICDSHRTGDTLARAILRQDGVVRNAAYRRMSLLVHGLRLMDNEATFVLQDDDGVVIDS